MFRVRWPDGWTPGGEEGFGQRWVDATPGIGDHGRGTRRDSESNVVQVQAATKELRRVGALVYPYPLCEVVGLSFVVRVGGGENRPAQIGRRPFSICEYERVTTSVRLEAVTVVPKCKDMPLLPAVWGANRCCRYNSTGVRGETYEPRKTQFCIM